MPGLADIIVALTGGALQGYAAQKTHQQQQKARMVMATVAKYPEAAADPDFAKVIDATFGKGSAGAIGGVASMRSKALAANNQNIINQFKQLQGGNAEAAATNIPGANATSTSAPTPAAPPQTQTQYETMLAARRAGTPTTTANPQPAPAASQVAPAAASPMAGQIPIERPLPPPPKTSMSLNTKTGAASLSMALGQPNLDEEDQATYRRIIKLQNQFPDTPLGVLIDHARDKEGRSLKPATEQHLKEAVGQTHYAHYIDQMGGDSQENRLRAAALVTGRDGLLLPQSVLEMTRQQSPAEKAREAGMVAMAGVPAAETKAAFDKALEVRNAETLAANRAKGELPYQKELIQERATTDVLKNATNYIQPDGTPGIVTAADRAIAKEHVSHFYIDTKQDRADIDAYNQLIGLLQHPEGLSQVDLLIAFNRLSSHGRTNQAGIEHDIETGVPMSRMWAKWNNIHIKGNLIMPEQVQQIAESAHSMYQQAKNSLDRKYNNVAKLIDTNKPGLHTAFLPPDMGTVLNPNTGEPVKLTIPQPASAAPAPPATPAAPATPKGFRLSDGPNAGQVVTNPADVRRLGATKADVLQ